MMVFMPAIALLVIIIIIIIILVNKKFSICYRQTIVVSLMIDANKYLIYIFDHTDAASSELINLMNISFNYCFFIVCIYDASI